MGKKDTDVKGQGLSRRDFVKASAAAAVAGGIADWTLTAEEAVAYEGVSGYTIKTTTCPYCSASCGQRVVVQDSTGEVVDLYGDFQSPHNSGGLCAKGAGSLQLVNNPRRLGAYTFPMTYQGATLAAHPEHAAFASDGTTNARAYKRTGNGAWSAMTLDAALGEIAPALKGHRGEFTIGEASGYNSQSVAFFGSSHMNNEENYLYRRLIAHFGTTNIEHQARI